jgi:hypothetical protein
MLTEVGGDYWGATEPGAGIIRHERSWFGASGGDVAEPPRSRILASRWTGSAGSRSEHLSEIDADRSRGRASADGRPYHFRGWKADPVRALAAR